MPFHPRWKQAAAVHGHNGGKLKSPPQTNKWCSIRITGFVRPFVCVVKKNTYVEHLSTIIYYIALPFIYLLSLLPFRVLYFLSDCLHFVLFTVVGYRKKVVQLNMKNSFPQKSPEEI